MNTVTLTIDRPLYDGDTELDCKETLRRVMLEFTELMSDDEKNRVADWFYDRYRVKVEL